MKKTDLAPSLQKTAEKVGEPGLENLWFVIPPPPPRKFPSGMPAQAISRALRLIEQLPSAHSLNELDRLTSYLFVRQEAVLSSRMEGTWSTMDHVLTPGEIYDRKEGKSERSSVLSYASALEKEFQPVFEKGISRFSVQLICRLHKEVLKNNPDYRKIPGRIRKSFVFIGGAQRLENSIFNPPPPKHVSRCLKEVLTWMRDPLLTEMGNAGMGMPLPVRMAIGHAHFEAVHPFPDGNGRVGRMLMTLQMASHGILPLYLSGYIEAEKNEYYLALQKAQKKLEYGPIVELICEALIASNEETKKTKQAIATLPGTWASRGAFRAGSAAHSLLTKLIIHPIFNISHVQDFLKITRPAANHAVAQLLDAKIVRERTGYERNRIFAAEEVIELLSKGFSEPPSQALKNAQALLNG